MTIEGYFIIILFVLFVCSNLFWLYHFNKLLNKFMSRNYAEFVQAENLKKPKEKFKPKLEVQVDGYDEQRARDLNQLMGMV